LVMTFIPTSLPLLDSKHRAGAALPVLASAAKYKASILSTQSLSHYRVATKSERVQWLASAQPGAFSPSRGMRVGPRQDPAVASAASIAAVRSSRSDISGRSDRPT